MPVTKSAKKALRVSQKKRVFNLRVKNKMKVLVKELLKKIEEKKIEEAKKLLPEVFKALDKATKRGIIKKNAASRKKSRLTKAINKLKVTG